ncbi:helix-turn-helix domain-containing protein [Ilyomonas limi]|nr:AraC family transcriptional regulator [Ilyomonas limi]
MSEANYPVKSVSLGEVVIKGTLNADENRSLNEKLLTKGFFIAGSLKETTIIKIKTALFEYLNNVLQQNERRKASAYVEQYVGLKYHYLSRLFSESEKMTIEQYLLLLKIEKAKELLLQNDVNIADVAYSLGYSCSQTFSTQFKKATGKTPLMFKQDPTPARVHLNRLTG